jgi:hypothetical protein
MRAPARNGLQKKGMLFCCVGGDGLYIKTGCVGWL